jgi:spermidine synthase
MRPRIIRPRSLFYALTLTVTAALGMVVEIAAGRMLAPYVGMSLYSWTAVIAVVLGGFSLGHWLGGRLAGPEVDHRLGCRRLAAILGATAVSAILSLPVLRLAAGAFGVDGADPIAAILVLATAGFFAPSLFVGMVSPIATKLAVDDAPPGEVGRVLGRMFALGAFGAIAGTLAAGFLFIAWIGSAGTMLAASGLYALFALAHLPAGFGRAAPAAAGALSVSAALALAAAAATGTLRGPCDAESAYFCIRIEDASALVGQKARLMALDHLAHGISVARDPSLLPMPYLHGLDEILAVRGLPRAPAALIIGGGAYTLPRAWAEAWPEGRIDVAELDPAVTAAARRAFWLGDRPNLRVAHADGRVALQAAPPLPRWDVVFADAFHDLSMPTHLVTREWHDAVASRLRPGGVYAVNVMEDRRDPRFLLALVRTLKERFAAVEVWVETADPGPGRRITYLVLASETPTPVPRVRANRGPDRTWARLPDRFVADRIARARVPVLTDDHAPVDRLMAHLVLSRDGAGR